MFGRGWWLLCAALTLTLAAPAAAGTNGTDPDPGSSEPVVTHNTFDNVTKHRLGLAVSIGPEVLASKGTTFVFGVTDFIARLRVTPEIEVGVDISLGLVGHSPPSIGGRAITGGAYVDAMYHFRADQPWTPYALLEVGGAAIYAYNGPGERKALRRSVRAGGGIERRYRTWGAQVDLRAIAIGGNDDVPMDDPPSTATSVARSPAYGAIMSFTVIGYF